MRSVRASKNSLLWATWYRDLVKVCSVTQLHGGKIALSLMIGLLGRVERRRLSGSSPLGEVDVVIGIPLG